MPFSDISDSKWANSRLDSFDVLSFSCQKSSLTLMTSVSLLYYNTINWPEFHYIGILWKFFCNMSTERACKLFIFWHHNSASRCHITWFNFFRLKTMASLQFCQGCMGLLLTVLLNVFWCPLTSPSHTHTLCSLPCISPKEWNPWN